MPEEQPDLIERILMWHPADSLMVLMGWMCLLSVLGSGFAIYVDIADAGCPASLVILPAIHVVSAVCFMLFVFPRLSGLMRVGRILTLAQLCEELSKQLWDTVICDMFIVSTNLLIILWLGWSQSARDCWLRDNPRILILLTTSLETSIFIVLGDKALQMRSDLMSTN